MVAGLVRISCAGADCLTVICLGAAMPLLGAVPVMLSAGERATLKKRVRGATTACRDRLRAQIVLAAARGAPQCPDRRRAGHQRRYGPQVAGPVRGPRAGRAAGPAPAGQAAADQRGGPG